MSASILDGAACSKIILKEIAKKVPQLRTQPGIAVVLVGDNPASHVYVKNKIRAATEVGFRSFPVFLENEASEQSLLAAMRRLNANPDVQGYLVQLPLPSHIKEATILSAIHPQKDIDGFHPVNQGMLLCGSPRILPATVRGILELLRRNGHDTAGKRVVILGRSAIVGRPLAAALLCKGQSGDATVTVAHSRTTHLESVCKEANILIVAIGQPRFVKDGAVVIDVGINRVDGKLCGDVDFHAVKEIASAITPVPGGVGPMTIASLLQNTLDAAARELRA
jgi:methylenetetrahydrofolate dehydrogenase (NADP+)/methenyltetrahydrofolate cyclohydrolase